MRITDKDLQNLCDRLNIVTRSPMAPYSEVESVGYHKIRDGMCVGALNFHIDSGYSQVSLVRMSGTPGCTGITRISGYMTKKELYNWIQAYCAGIEASNNV
jgi:hypothetical protein